MSKIEKKSVDRAIHSRSGIDEEIKSHVLKVARKLSYTPNRAARSLALLKNKKIGLICPTDPDFFWNNVRKGFETAEKEITGYGAELFYKEMRSLQEEDTLIGHIDALIEQGVDAIILIPINSPRFLGKVKEINKLGVSVVTLNSDIGNSEDRVFFVGPDNYQSGRVAARLMSDSVRGSGNICVVGQSMVSLSYKARYKSFIETIQKDYPNLSLVEHHLIKDMQISHERKTFMESVAADTELKGIYDVDGGSLAEIGEILKNFGKSG